MGRWCKTWNWYVQLEWRRGIHRIIWKWCTSRSRRNEITQWNLLGTMAIRYEAWSWCFHLWKWWSVCWAMESGYATWWRHDDWCGNRIANDGNLWIGIACIMVRWSNPRGRWIATIRIGRIDWIKLGIRMMKELKRLAYLFKHLKNYKV